MFLRRKIRKAEKTNIFLSLLFVVHFYPYNKYYSSSFYNIKALRIDLMCCLNLIANKNSVFVSSSSEMICNVGREGNQNGTKLHFMHKESDIVTLFSKLGAEFCGKRFLLGKWGNCFPLLLLFTQGNLLGKH